jgi:2'-hydroxyisoflavone reductase
MRILILGGTVFLGYHLVASAMSKGHEVTIFTRGISNSDVYPEVDHLVGNRDGDLDALRGKQWDAVIDTSGYVPRVVEDSVELLRDAVDHYTFISSISVYDDFSSPDIDETAAVAQLKDPLSENIAEFYGALKASCEKVVENAMPGKSLIIRPGLIVGPRDTSDRFTYWPVRIKRGGEVLAPGNPDTFVQFIDVRDLADWIIRMVEHKQTGVYQATGPNKSVTFGTFLETCRQATGSDAQLTWVDESYLVEQEVGAWLELPLWIPATPDYEKMAYFQQVNIEKATRAGLSFRPLEETIQDTIVWDESRDPGLARKAGLNPDKEKELLSQNKN